MLRGLWSQICAALASVFVKQNERVIEATKRERQTWREKELQYVQRKADGQGGTLYGISDCPGNP